LVVISSPRKPNHPWKKRFHGGGKEREGYKRGAHQPWLLPTSLTELPAEQIVALYATRMQIEQIFRDLKNPRFGWCLRHARGYCAARLTILLLIASLGALVAILIGLAVEQRGHHRAYQANTVRTRVLSLFVLGLNSSNEMILFRSAISCSEPPFSEQLSQLTSREFLHDFVGITQPQGGGKLTAL